MSKAVMTKEDAQKFTDELRDLCAAHGVMLWTAVKSTPIILSPADKTDLKRIRYVVSQPEAALQTFLIRRLIGTEAE